MSGNNNEQDSLKKKWAPNFTSKEDVQLAKSWVVISEDAIQSNQQSKDKFFARIAKDYNTYNSGAQRDANQLQSRWKIIQPAILRFGAIHDQISKNPASGSAPADWLTDAKEMFFRTEKKPFIYENAWNLLKVSPKWRTILDGKAKNGAQPSV
ncbi:hypothetical protein PTTG_01971, partial [Puccinia triticina 1-1 BBBD Race 1]